MFSFIRMFQFDISDAARAMQFLCGFLLVCWIADSFDCNGASFQESKDKDDKKEKKSKEDNDDKKDKDTRACHIT